MKPPLYSLGSLVQVAIISLFTASCNMTAPMPVPRAFPGTLVNIDAPASQQASFALSRIVANLRRGEVVAHFPTAGVEGVDDILCNQGYRGGATIEWGTGSLTLGNWSSELGEIFFEVLSQRGLNIAGDPKDLFKQQDAASSAEYLLGARISTLKGNFCHVHDLWDGPPRNEYSGEMFIVVEWTVFSSLRRSEVMRLTTEGYYKLKQARPAGIEITFQNAFARSVEKMATNKAFIDLALRRKSIDQPQAAKAAPSDPQIVINQQKPGKRAIKDRLDQILSSVVTVRVGQGHGSGFVIAENGLIITNAHVVGEAQKVAIILSNRIELEGEVLRVDKRRDVALVKIPVQVPSVFSLREGPVQPLEQVFVVGTPMLEGLRSTITGGIVSAVRRDERTDLDFIQSDAASSPGNSGGPLLDNNGNVVGISVAKLVSRGSEGLNLFIPINSALKALNITRAQSRD